jgi:hypothetical protein
MFEASYDCRLDAAIPPNANCARVYSFRSAGESFRLVRCSCQNGAEWWAELAAGVLDRDGLTGVYATPSLRHALVVVTGLSYYVDVCSAGGVARLQPEPVKHIVQLPDLGVMLILTPCEVTAFGTSGHLWTSGRIGYDGITFLAADQRELRFEVDRLGEQGEARLSLQTGMSL